MNSLLNSRSPKPLFCFKPRGISFSNKIVYINVHSGTHVYFIKTTAKASFQNQSFTMLNPVGQRQLLKLAIYRVKVKEPTHYSYKSRMIPVLWLSFVCKWRVGEVGHLVRDLEVLLCPFPLSNKSCPVEWTRSNHYFFSR